MPAEFYRAFEDRHRGSLEFVRQRLEVYRPMLEVLRGVVAERRVTDLGCGRGEWLDTLQSMGFEADGVDLDEGMLAAPRERGLSVQVADAIEHLDALPDASRAMISALQVVEHIPFEQVQALVAHAHRVLVPGGLLLLETPNPQNLVVATETFYLDPTHVRPVPQQLLEFLLEYQGFATSARWGLQESVATVNGSAPNLMMVLNGVSPDYAVMGQKGGDVDALAALAPVLHSEHGVRLETLAARYEESLAERFISLREETQSRLDHWERRLESRLCEAQQAQAAVQQAHAATQAELRAVLNSRSWRLTAPLRHLSSAISGLRAGLRERRWRAWAWLVQRAPLRPGLRRPVIAVARRLGLEDRLRRLLRRARAARAASPERASSGGQDLSSHAQEMYRALLQRQLERQRLGDPEQKGTRDGEGS